MISDQRRDNEIASWNRRMAEAICAADTLTVAMVEGILEAAGELKAVRAKVLLGRAMEVIEGFSDVKGRQTIGEFVAELGRELNMHGE